MFGVWPVFDTTADSLLAVVLQAVVQVFVCFFSGKVLWVVEETRLRVCLDK